jgi:spiro-SPASM protein
MNAHFCLYGGALREEAFAEVFAGKNAVTLAVEKAAAFPFVSKTTIFLRGDFDERRLPPLTGKIGTVKRGGWTVKSLLEQLAREGAGFDMTYFAWADSPFLDPVLAGRLVARHQSYRAEYSYSDGWPYGFSPECLSPGTAAILANICDSFAGRDRPPERDSLFAVLQKDINSFDIETEIAPVDLRSRRLVLAADSKRNLLLLRRFADAGFSTADDAETFVRGRPLLLRTLPAFYPVQVSGVCPQECAFCPYPASRGTPVSDTALVSDAQTVVSDTASVSDTFMPLSRFTTLLDNIAAFSGDAVIDLSLWGELSLHPQKSALVKAVLERPALSLVIETCGIGWKAKELEALADEAKKAAPRVNGMAALSWIVSLDTADAERYRSLHGEGFEEAAQCAKRLLALFPQDAYVQAVRTAGAEVDIEKFYRKWKEAGVNGLRTDNIIIQKYDYFCGKLPDLRAGDIRPVNREPCWHLMRDMPVLINGDVPLCREEIVADTAGNIIGNVFEESLAAIWEKGEERYGAHCRVSYTADTENDGKKNEYPALCAGCDEYYTYNF